MLNPETVCACYLPPVLAAGSSFEVEPIETAVHNPDEIEHAITAFAKTANGGLVVLPDITTIVHRELIIRLATQLRTPRQPVGSQANLTGRIVQVQYVRPLRHGR